MATQTLADLTANPELAVEQATADTDSAGKTTILSARMAIYAALCQVQDAYRALELHRCSANDFEIAYWQENRKLREIMSTNKALELQLQESQSRIDHYEQVTLPNYQRAEENAEDHTMFLQSKIDTLRNELFNITQTPDDQDILGREKPGQEKPGQEKPGQEKPGQEEPGQEEPGQEEPPQKRRRANQIKLRRIAKEALLR